MKLHSLLTYADEAQAAADIAGDSPVFAVVRNQSAPLDSEDAWHAVSIVGLDVDAQDGSILLIANPADDAIDMSLTTLRARVKKLPTSGLQQSLFVSLSTEPAGRPDAVNALEVVEAYGDEHGLGLMLWFEGYEKWLESQS